MTIILRSAPPLPGSRRVLLILAAMATLSGLPGCKAPAPPPAPPPKSDPADAQLQRLEDAYASLARGEPALPGVRSLARIPANLTAGMSKADLDLLDGAIGLKARQRTRLIDKPIDEAGVRTILSNPIDTSRLARPFLDQLLADAKADVAANPAARSVYVPMGNHSGQIWCKNPDTDEPIDVVTCHVLGLMLVDRYLSTYYLSP